ncbi:MAG: hypothetical protein P4L45_08925 [Ignavibacteriaceae bacterium]|nr:hypothetical protein [Ignavibacteriaceae bacterium]
MKTNVKLPRIITTEAGLKELSINFSASHNLLIPTAVFYNNYMGLMPVEIILDSRYDTGDNDNKEKHRNDDVWSADGGETFSLTKHAVDKIALASGVAFKDSKVVIRELDEGTKRVVYIKHNVYWEKPDLSGMMQSGHSTGEYSYYEDIARFRYKQETIVQSDILKDGRIILQKGQVQHKKGDPINDQIESRRNFAGALAESNAKIRAFNEAICEFPKSFTRQELQKPFLLVRVAPNIEGALNENPELRPLYSANVLGIGHLIYGTPQTMPNPVIILGNKAGTESYAFTKQVQEMPACSSAKVQGPLQYSGGKETRKKSA